MSGGRVEGKVAWVTGASRGIGREIALTLAREGADVGVGHFPDAAETARAGEVVEACRALGRRAIALPADVAEAGAVRASAAALLEALGGLDVVVTNAGIVHRQPVIDLPEADWDRVVAVNLKGTFNTVQAALPHLTRQRSGKVITVASELALAGRASLAAYAASKAGVIGFTKCLARELAPLGIQANVVAPGPTDTDMLRDNPAFRDENKAAIPLGRWGQPRDVALTVLFLASADSDYYAGQILSPNGGVVM
jgi:3-oxoacyl-[acyl-carrier protein] reductase